MAVDAVLLDIDGVLTVSWEALPGAQEAVHRLRSEGVPFLLLTNTTVMNSQELTDALRGAGLDVRKSDLLTAAMATGEYLRAHHDRCLLLGGADLSEELRGVTPTTNDADAVVVAGADHTFTWENLNRALHELQHNGAKLIAMHRNLTWETKEGTKLDAGVYVGALERIAGVEATVIGKPSPGFFRMGLDRLGLPPERVAMLGDDLHSDVLAAQSFGMTGVLVNTRGYSLDEVSSHGRGGPDHVIGSVGDLAELLAKLRT